MEDYSIPGGRKGGSSGVGGGLAILLSSNRLELFCILSLIILFGPSASMSMTMTSEATESESLIQSKADPISNTKTANTEQQLYFKKLDEEQQRYLVNDNQVETLDLMGESLEDNNDELVGRPLNSNPRYIRSEGGPTRNGDDNINRLSRAFERIHFGPLLRQFRQISNRAPSTPNHGSGSIGSSGSGSDSMMSHNNYTPRNRVSSSSFHPHSGESFPVGGGGGGRFSSRPTIMRLRWGRRK